ncbi:MAG: hypothetical protein BHW00_06970 [Clostridium sp. 26_22]|nr:MAG: hypothetical protein BHW00_06970 [Clostridium sp. 26_22]
MKMVITIFFMLASICLIIILPIYLRKKNRMYNLGTQEKTNIKKQRKNIKTIWGIEEIKNQMLTINNSHSIVIELGSIEYRLLNDEEQNNIDNNLKKIAKTFTNQTQFFSTIEKIDTTDKIDNIRENIERQRNNNIKEYGKSIIEYLDNIMQEDDLYVRKNYLIITSFEPYDKAERELKEYYDDLRYSLSNIKVTARLLSDMDIIELIYRELNKNSNEQLRNIIKKGGLDFYVQSESKA